MIYESFSANKTSSPQSRKKGSINERLHLFAKDEKNYKFINYNI